MRNKKEGRKKGSREKWKNGGWRGKGEAYRGRIGTIPAMDFAVCGIIPLGRVEMKTVLGNFGLTISRLKMGEIAKRLFGWRDIWDNLRVKELFLWTCHKIDRLVGFLYDKFAQQCPYYIHWSIVHHDRAILFVSVWLALVHVWQISFSICLTIYQWLGMTMIVLFYSIMIIWS